MKNLFAIALLALGLASVARADAWNEDTVTWSPPTTCSDGSPVSQCPVTGYRVETASSKTSATWITAATVGVITQAKITGLAAGTHCYRVVALSAAGASDAAVQGNDCPVTVAPVPSPPSDVRTVETVAYTIRPDFQHFAFVRSKRWGSVRLGAACDEDRTTGDGYYVVSSRRMVKPRPPEGTYVVARCG